MKSKSFVWVFVAHFFFVPSISMASKARLDSLQGAKHLREAQTIFTNPAHLASFGQYLTAEFGGNSNNGEPKAEGGIFFNKLGGTLGLYMGHINPYQKRLRETENYLLENNPVELFFAKDKVGASFYYSRDSLQSSAGDRGQNSVGARVGYAGEKLEGFLTLEIKSDSQKTSIDKYKTEFPSFHAGAEYDLGGIYAFAEANMIRAEADIATPVVRRGADLNLATYQAGFVDRSFSNETTDIYYGLSAKYDLLTKHIFKVYNLTLPVVIGVESSLAEWVSLRASLTQNVLLGYSRDQTAAAPANKRNTVANNTTAALGAGFFVKGFQIDGVAEAGTTGDLNASSLLGRASLTYSF